MHNVGAAKNRGDDNLSGFAIAQAVIAQPSATKGAEFSGRALRNTG